MIDTKISWDELTELGRIASEKLDTGRWEIGDLACLVEKEHGGFIANFAREIGQQIRTVQGYHRTARAFPQRVRADAFAKWPNLFYSHYRTAARLETPREQLAFLEDTSANGWTTDEADYHMGLLLGKPERTETAIQESITAPELLATVSRKYIQDDGAYLTLRLTDNLMPDDIIGKSVRIMIVSD